MEFYYYERSCLLGCLCALFRISLSDTNHPYFQPVVATLSMPLLITTAQVHRCSKWAMRWDGGYDLVQNLWPLQKCRVWRHMFWVNMRSSVN
jgi:hypothetical protein